MKATRSGVRLAWALRIAKGVSSRHSPAARQRWASSGFSTVSNRMQAPLIPPHPCLIPSPTPNRARGGSAHALNWYDGAAMGAFADLLVLVVGLDLEPELAAVDLQKLGAGRDL